MYSRYFLQLFYFVKYWICILLQQLLHQLLPCSSFSLDFLPSASYLPPSGLTQNPVKWMEWFGGLEGTVDQSSLCHFKRVFHISDGETSAWLHGLILVCRFALLGNALFFNPSALLFCLRWQWEEKCCCSLLCKCSHLGMGQPPP